MIVVTRPSLSSLTLSVHPEMPIRDPPWMSPGTGKSRTAARRFCSEAAWPHPMPADRPRPCARPS